MRSRAKAAGSLRAGAVFARAAHTYWTSVFPKVASELASWRERAENIADPALRAPALQALAKRGNMEGAAAFAAFAPHKHRAAVVRASVAFQTAYNHLDALSEQPGSVGSKEVRRLHLALLGALACQNGYRGLQLGACPVWRESMASGHDYERPIHPPKNNDGGYLAALVDACQRALRELPSYDAVAAAALRAAERVVCFQVFNGHERTMIEHWGREQMPVWSGLRWWETAASSGSSLGVHVMIAAAAEPGIGWAQVDALERSYFPWIGALHSMLDQLIDIEEDARTGQPNLIELYGSPAEAAERMALLAERALECARGLGPGWRHELIVAAMASFYLSAPQARQGEAAVVTRAVLEMFGGLARPALAVFRLRRVAETVAEGVVLMPGRAGAGSVRRSVRAPLRDVRQVRPSRSAG